MRTIDEAISLMENEKACIIKADTCDRDCAKCELVKKTEDLLSAYDMAIRALKMQKKLSEFSGMDICRWVEDYDYDENNISEYEFEANVDDFLIDEIDEEAEEEE